MLCYDWHHIWRRHRHGNDLPVLHSNHKVMTLIRVESIFIHERIRFAGIMFS
jgi:hypothetical protein